VRAALVARRGWRGLWPSNASAWAPAGSWHGAATVQRRCGRVVQACWFAVGGRCDSSRPGEGALRGQRQALTEEVERAIVGGTNTLRKHEGLSQAVQG